MVFRARAQVKLCRVDAGCAPFPSTGGAASRARGGSLGWQGVGLGPLGCAAAPAARALDPAAATAADFARPTTPNRRPRVITAMRSKVAHCKRSPLRRSSRHAHKLRDRDQRLCSGLEPPPYAVLLVALREPCLRCDRVGLDGPVGS